MKITLPKLKYGYKELEPVISEEQLKIHHTKHHQGYVNGANALLSKGYPMDLKKWSFHIGGHALHSLFWENMTPKKTKLSRKLKKAFESCFGSLEKFKEEFSKVASSVEGSGWGALVQCQHTGKLGLMQIEKHNQNMYPDVNMLLVVDVWEHAYYLDYKNDRGAFVKAFWDIVNWDAVSKRLK